MTYKLLLASLCVSGLMAEELPREREMVVAHEWGTFTSVASEDGSAVKWAPLSGPADLPCFVARISPNGSSPKGYAGYVRMETPVIYFYAQRHTTLSVRVGFPQGWITEWYPHATSVKPAIGTMTQPDGYRNGQIAWNNFELMPGENPQLPIGKTGSHYYAARNTDSSPLRIGQEWEKLIFYRGIGDFDVPLQPAYTKEGLLRIRNEQSLQIPFAMLFENRSGKIGYRTARGLGRVTELEQPNLDATMADLRRDLETELVQAGLYRKEAQAMVETWRDSWFEEGARLFYLLPQAFVNKVLPLEVTPAPSSTARVFVGRIELFSKGVEETISNALESGDIAAAARFGRFLQPFAEQLGRQNPTLIRSSKNYSLAVSKVMQEVYSGRTCVP